MTDKRLKPAKINLTWMFKKEEDGYHEVEMVMRPSIFMMSWSFG